MSTELLPRSAMHKLIMLPSTTCLVMVLMGCSGSEATSPTHPTPVAVAPVFSKVTVVTPVTARVGAVQPVAAPSHLRTLATAFPAHMECFAAVDNPPVLDQYQRFFGAESLDFRRSDSTLDWGRKTDQRGHGARSTDWYPKDIPWPGHFSKIYSVTSGPRPGYFLLAGSDSIKGSQESPGRNGTISDLTISEPFKSSDGKFDLIEYKFLLTEDEQADLPKRATTFSCSSAELTDTALTEANAVARVERQAHRDAMVGRYGAAIDAIRVKGGVCSTLADRLESFLEDRDGANFQAWLARKAEMGC